MLNPIEEVAAVAREHGCKLLIDAVASFGAFPLDVAALDAEAVFVSPNKCLESVPGIAMVIARRVAIEAAAERSASVVLDLHAQWRFFEEVGVVALDPAHPRRRRARARVRAPPGGGRGRETARPLSTELAPPGDRPSRTRLPDPAARRGGGADHRDIHDPDDPSYTFEALYHALERRNIVIFPGRLTATGTFRIGVMGDLVESDMEVIPGRDGRGVGGDWGRYGARKGGPGRSVVIRVLIIDPQFDDDPDIERGGGGYGVTFEIVPPR